MEKIEETHADNAIKKIKVRNKELKKLLARKNKAINLLLDICIGYGELLQAKMEELKKKKQSNF